MDIINQRLENINRNASFNRSTTELLDDSLSVDVKATPTHSENIDRTTVAVGAVTPVTETNGNAIQLKPLKRKLFAPPSLFPENSPILDIMPQKTDKKTATQKRKRNDFGAGEKSTKTDEKKLPIEKPMTAIKKTNSRRSTLFFQEAPILNKTKTTAIPSSSTNVRSTTSAAAIQKTHSTVPGLVFTSMHKPQIDFITEVRQG